MTSAHRPTTLQPNPAPWFAAESGCDICGKCRPTETTRPAPKRVRPVMRRARRNRKHEQAPNTRLAA
jgi:hypothetical protein